MKSREEIEFKIDQFEKEIWAIKDEIGEDNENAITCLRAVQVELLLWVLED